MSIYNKNSTTLLLCLIGFLFFLIPINLKAQACKCTGEANFTLCSVSKQTLTTPINKKIKPNQVINKINGCGIIKPIVRGKINANKEFCITKSYCKAMSNKKGSKLGGNYEVNCKIISTSNYDIQPKGECNNESTPPKVSTAMNKVPNDKKKVKAQSKKFKKRINNDYERKKVSLNNPLQGDIKTVPALAGRVIKTILSVIGSVALIAFVVGGVRWLISGGKPEQIKKGAKTMLYAVVGLFVVFGSYGILQLIITTLKNGAG